MYNRTLEWDVWLRGCESVLPTRVLTIVNAQEVLHAWVGYSYIGDTGSVINDSRGSTFGRVGESALGEEDGDQMNERSHVGGGHAQAAELNDCLVVTSGRY